MGIAYLKQEKNIIHTENSLIEINKKGLRIDNSADIDCNEEG